MPPSWKYAILELKKHDQVDTDVGSVYVKFINYDVTAFLKVSDLHSLFGVSHGPARIRVILAG